MTHFRALTHPVPAMREQFSIPSVILACVAQQAPMLPDRRELTYIPRVPANNKPEREYKVGDHIQISLNNRIIDAVVRAVIEQTDGLRLQVDFGHEQTALIYERQVVKD